MTKRKCYVLTDGTTIFLGKKFTEEEFQKEQIEARLRTNHGLYWDEVNEEEYAGVFFF